MSNMWCFNNEQLQLWESNNNRYLFRYVFTDNTYINRNPNVKHNIDTLAKTITLNDNTYILAGLIHYISCGSNTNGHYIAFSFAGTHWYIYDDLKKNAK